jgi:hypothetical protein
MMVDLSALAYAVRKHCAAQGINFPIGHAHQLLAAAFGHGTLAALQASPDVNTLADAAFLVIDGQRVDTRATELGLAPSEVLIEVVMSVLRDTLSASVHRNADSFVDALQTFVDDRTVNDGRVEGEMAMTNGDLDEIYMPLDLWSEVDLDNGEHVATDIVGHVSVRQHPDRVFWGDHIDVEATLALDRVGKRLFANAQLEVTRAELRWFNECDETEHSASDLA